MWMIRDKNTRFLLTGTGLIMAAALLLGGFFHFRLLRQVKLLYVSQLSSMAGKLLERGMDRGEVAACLDVSDDSFAEGKRLMAELGYGSDMPVIAVPELTKFAGKQLAVLAALYLTVMLAACLLFFFWQRREKKRLLGAQRQVEAYMEGKFESRLPVTDEGEVCRLFGAVNRMAAVLYTKGKAEERAKAFLQDMIADISHQFKTPIAALSMNTEIMEEDAQNPEVVRSFSQKNRKSLERLQTLIENFLKVARLDAGTVVFERRKIAAWKIAESAVEELRVRAQTEGKQLCLEGETEAELFCDPSWTKEAVSNLIKNALDHTKSGGQIRVRVRQTPLFLEISVQDDGEGIHEEDLCHIFKRFYRSRFSQDTQGVGLGLGLVKAIAEGQGGQVRVQSKIGEGAVFSLILKNLEN